MYGVLRKTLCKGISSSNLLSDNNYAKWLLFLLDSSSQLPSLEMLASINTQTAPTPHISEDTSPKQSSTSKDLRLKALYLQGIKKFPSNDSTYHINFMQGGIPVSSIFLGSNGIGKSSLFSSLEYICLGHTYLADERGYDTAEKQKKYLQHNATNPTRTRITIHTLADIFSATIDEPISRIVPPAFFCSEYDIQEISRNGLQSNYVCRQLGLERYHSLLQLMSSMAVSDNDYNTFTERKHDIEHLQRRISVMQFLSTLEYNHLHIYRNVLERIEDLMVAVKSIENLREFTTRIRIQLNLLPDKEIETDYDVTQHILAALNDVEENIKPYLDSQPELPTSANEIFNVCMTRLSSLYFIWKEEIDFRLSVKEGSERQRKYRYIKAISKIIYELKTYEEQNRSALAAKPLLNYTKDSLLLFNKTFGYLKDEYQRLLESYVEIINRILPELFKKYFDQDIHSIQAKVSEDGLSIAVSIEACTPFNSDTSHTSEPRCMLNTFRFKMFCFTLKFALACSVKKYHSVNFPFIVDDVFDASDFENRTDIGTLIGALITRHNSIEGLAERPLQLIFFTQDNIIADAIKRASNAFEDIKFSRLFDYYCADETDIKETSGPDRMKYIRIEDPI